MIWPIWEARAEIQKYLCWFFGSNEKFINCFHEIIWHLAKVGWWNLCPPHFPSFTYYFLGKICYPNKSHIPWKYSLQVSSFFIVSYFQYSWQSSGYEAHSVGWAWSRIVIMQADPCFKLGSHSKYPSLPYCTVYTR